METETPEHITAKLKRLLPGNRDTFGRVLDTDMNPIMEDAEEAENITKHWTEQWAKRDTFISPTMERWVQQYIRDKGQMEWEQEDLQKPLEFFEDIILSTNDSAAGPDNIPFIAYRANLDLVAPIFRECTLNLISEHGFQPADLFNFNIANLVLIPKKPTKTINEVDYHLPRDLRPISISNTDNRVIACSIKEILGEKMYSWISQQQKGGIPGRVGTDNVKDLTHHFYKDVAEEREGYLLLIDFEAAFPSIAHSWLLYILGKMGVPKGVVGAYGKLLTGTKHMLKWRSDVYPSAPSASGVKQGCPLSPLAFCAGVDILNWLFSDPRAVTRTYMDDTGFYIKDIQYFVSNIAPKMKEFCRATGMKINFRKTIFLATREEDENKLRDILNATGEWRHAKIESKAEYLGFFIGREVETELIFEKARKKLIKVFNKWRGTPITYATKIMIANVYFMSLFGYVGQIYTVPKATMSIIKRICLTFVCGNNWGNYDLLTSLSCLAKLPAIRDPFTSSVAAILSHTELSGETIQNTPTPDERMWEDEWKYSEDYLVECLDKDWDTWKLQTINKKYKPTQARVYKEMIESQNNTKAARELLKERATKRWRIPAAQAAQTVQHVLDNIAKTQRQISDKYRMYQLALFCNGWPTERRTANGNA